MNRVFSSIQTFLLYFQNENRVFRISHKGLHVSYSFEADKDETLEKYVELYFKMVVIFCYHVIVNFHFLDAQEVCIEFHWYVHIFLDGYITLNTLLRQKITLVVPLYQVFLLHLRLQHHKTMVR